VISRLDFVISYDVSRLGYKWITDPPPVIKYLKEGTKITWEGKNLKAFNAYKFEW